ncbi:MAG: acyl carrier protein [Gloeocapsa sp. DLM2.Bin57]|nr:MAG: acyl carrier protein [Gloeocapsa sp. DLM2.Bin57]
MQLQDSNCKTNTPETIIQNWLVKQIAANLSLDPGQLDLNQPLTRYGLDSIDAVTLVGELEDWLDEELPATLFWDYPSIAQAAQYLAQNFDLSNIIS